jgi:hypothetical protein
MIDGVEFAEFPIVVVLDAGEAGVLYRAGDYARRAWEEGLRAPAPLLVSAQQKLLDALSEQVALVAD